jgi:putative alpha-1,2-mannosidase
MKRSLILLFVICSSWAYAQNTRQTGVVQYVNPFIGTGAVDTNSLSGSNFPGPTRPFAFVQLSPDTREAPDDPASGYDHNDKTIVGFSHTHLSGTGVADLFDVLFMPTTGELKLKPGDPKVSGSGYRSAFSHDQETARPGYYQVMLQDYGINVELTSTSHVGMHRYTFPASTQSHIVIDMDLKIGCYPSDKSKNQKASQDHKTAKHQ